MIDTIQQAQPVTSGHAEVNGIKLYYELYGEGQPLVVLHGGGSTIQTSFGNLIPFLANRFRVIAVDLQNHGRSSYRMVPQTLESLLPQKMG